MLNNLKRYLINKIQSRPPKYLDETKTNIIIQINNYFTKESWGKKIKEIIGDNKAINFIFVKNRYRLIEVINYCVAGFFFDLDNAYVNSPTRIKFIYMGISGHHFNQKQLENIKFYSSKGISSSAISEYVLMTAILITNNYQKFMNFNFIKRWKQKPVLLKEYNTITNYKIGVLGVGKNGKAVASLFSKIGCQVFGCDNDIQVDLPFVDGWFKVQEMEKFCNIIDILVLCIPETKQTKNLINFSFMKNNLQGKYIINISRGSIINQKDLKKCLKEKILAGVVLDVFNKEPLPIYDTLWYYKNTFITPHISGNINRFVTIIQMDFLNKIISEYDYIKQNDF